MSHPLWVRLPPCLHKKKTYISHKSFFKTLTLTGAGGGNPTLKICRFSGNPCLTHCGFDSHLVYIKKRLTYRINLFFKTLTLTGAGGGSRTHTVSHLPLKQARLPFRHARTSFLLYRFIIFLSFKFVKCFLKKSFLFYKFIV